MTQYYIKCDELVWLKFRYIYLLRFWVFAVLTWLDVFQHLLFQCTDAILENEVHCQTVTYPPSVTYLKFKIQTDEVCWLTRWLYTLTLHTKCFVFLYVVYRLKVASSKMASSILQCSISQPFWLSTLKNFWLMSKFPLSGCLRILEARGDDSTQNRKFRFFFLNPVNILKPLRNPDPRVGSHCFCNLPTD